jgi:hypothetical protein
MECAVARFQAVFEGRLKPGLQQGTGRGLRRGPVVTKGFEIGDGNGRVDSKVKNGKKEYPPGDELEERQFITDPVFAYRGG